MNILLDRTLVSRLCSCFEPENDRDEVYPVDFVSQLYYRIHTMCGGRSSRNEAELLIPKFSKNEDDTIAPKHLLPHVFNAVAFERSAQNNSPIYSTMWRRIFSEARRKQHEDPDVRGCITLSYESNTLEYYEHRY